MSILETAATPLRQNVRPSTHVTVKCMHVACSLKLRLRILFNQRDRKTFIARSRRRSVLFCNWIRHSGFKALLYYLAISRRLDFLNKIRTQ